jgi:hypothetical protein
MRGVSVVFGAAFDRGDGGSSAQKSRKNRVISTEKLFLKNIPRGGLCAAAKHGTLWSDQMNSFRSFKYLFTLHERVFWSASAPHHPLSERREDAAARLPGIIFAAKCDPAGSSITLIMRMTAFQAVIFFVFAKNT